MAFSEAVKHEVKRRAHFTCCWCGDRQRKVDIHHVVPQAEGGADTVENAAPLCGACHTLYGNNPDLRKEICGRRDHWYELCAGKAPEAAAGGVGPSDPAVQALVRELAADNPGLCVITTRLAVADVAGCGGTVAVDLEQLPVAAGRLVAAGDAGGVDAHPLVREHFGERLRETAPAAWRAGHERLYEHYEQAAPELPETLEAMLPLYAAVVHGCRAGRVQEAMDAVYYRRILRGAEAFSWRKLGAFGAELTALAAFFERLWERPDPRLTAAAEAFLLSQAGFHLRALGRLREAVQPMRAAKARCVAEEDWGRRPRRRSQSPRAGARDRPRDGVRAAGAGGGVRGVGAGIRRGLSP